MTSDTRLASQAQSAKMPQMDADVRAEANSEARTGTFAALRVPSFAWFLAGTTLTNSAQWIQSVTLSWLVYDLTSSGAALGTVNLLRSIASLGLAPLVGVAIDRLPNRRLLYGTGIWLCAVSLGFGLALLLGDLSNVWPLFLYSFLGGVGQAFSVPLRQTVVFAIVPRRHAPGAVAMVQTGWAVMRSLGPAVGGFLLLWFGPAGNFLVQAGAYALVVLTVLKLRLPYEKLGEDETHRVTKATAETGVVASSGFREALKYILSEPTTLAFLLMSWVLPLLIIPNFNALPPIYAIDVFEGGPDTLGTLLSAVGIGGIVGGFVTASLGKLDRRGLVQLAALLLIGLSFAAFAFSSRFWLALIAIAVAGFFEMIYLTTNNTLLQLSIPDELRGRVTSVMSLRSGLTPVGAFVAGIGADLVGPRAMTLGFSAFIVAIAVTVYLFVPVVREYRLSAAMAGPDTAPSA